MEPEKKVVSLQQVYDQVQGMMDEAGIGTRTLHIDAGIHSYEHRKLGTYSKGIADTSLDKNLKVYIGGIPSITCDHPSPYVVIETIRVELEKLKITRNPVDVIRDIELELT